MADRHGGETTRAEASKNSRVKIDGKHDLEEFSLALQVMISRLQDIERFRRAKRLPVF